MTDAIRSAASLAAGLALGLALASSAGAQAAGDFDLSSLDIPEGFLDLTDVALATGSHGNVIAVGTTVLGNARANLLLAIDPSLGLREGMTLAIKPEAWKLTEAIPALSNPILDGIDFSHVALVLAPEARELLSAELTDDEWHFYREVYGTDEFRLTLRPGINLIATIPAEGLEPGHPMIVVMDALGIEKGAILVQGGLGRSLSLLGGGGGGAASAVRDMYLRAELPPVRPPGSPEWFRGGQLALELTGDPMVRFVGELSLEIDEQVLDFFVATSLARTGMALTGGLIAEGGWEQPFGIEWLIFRGVVLQLAITPTGSIQPGFAASMVIGEKDIDVAVALAISPAGVPTNLMFTGASESGVAFSDLVQLQQRMAAARQAAAEATGAGGAGAPALPVDALPDMAFRSLELGFASKDAPELGIERGFKLAGQLWLPLSADGELSEFAGVDVDVSEEGIIARGELGAFQLGPLVWEDAALDLTATRETQHLMVKGAVDLFGTHQLVDLWISKERMSFESETNMFDMFTADISATADINIRSPEFQVHAVAHADFGDAVGPMAQDAIARFAANSGDVVAAAGEVSAAAAEAVADAEATVEELRATLEALRGQAVANLRAAEQRAAAAERAMRSAWAVRNRALRTYYATPGWPVWRKTQRLVAYRRAHGRYRIQAIVYNARATAVAARLRILQAIPPVDENVLMLSTQEALRVLRAQLEETQRQLSQLESQIAAITDALERGEQLLVIERAEFQAGLQSALNGEAIRWNITGRFVGEAFEVDRTLDFSDPAAGAAAMLQELIAPGASL